MDRIIKKLARQLDRLPTEDEVFFFVFGTDDDRKRIWALGKKE